MADNENSLFKVRFLTAKGHLKTKKFPKEDEAREYMIHHPDSFMIKPIRKVS